MKKVLVFGATGMAGHVISQYLEEAGYDVYGIVRQKTDNKKHILCEAHNQTRVKLILGDGDFDIVINCIGLLNQKCDDNPREAFYLNSYFPHFLAECIKTTKTRLIHLSTDCVFSGNTPPYYECSLKDGETVYDRTKALGEVIDDKNLTFRNSIIGPDKKENGIGLFNWFMKQSGTIYGYSNVKWTGVTTIVLAKAIDEAIKQDLTGLYNLVNNKYISKKLLLEEFKEAFNRDVEILEDKKHVCEKILINTREDFNFNVPDYHTMIDEMYSWVNKHRDIYKHYFKD